MILLWGLRQDAPVIRVLGELERMSVPVVLIDQRAILSMGITLDVDEGVTGFVMNGGDKVDLAEVTGAYPRPYDSWRIGAVAAAGRDSDECRHALAFDEVMWLWCELTPAVVLNRPSAMASNCSKPLQALTIQAHGFLVPDTLVTTDPQAARAFIAEHDGAIYKSTGNVRSIVAAVDPSDERLDDVAWCPTQFQELIPGADYRVHVVGDDLFVCRIESPVTDYRYSHRQGHDVAITLARLPDDLPERCVALATDLGLRLAGIDLRRTPDGRWYCFEANPSPAFTYYDRHGQGIAGAIARLLARDEETC